MIKFIGFILLFNMFGGCVEDRRVTKGVSNLTGSSTRSSFISPDEASKKVDQEKLGIPRECTTFALYIQENCLGEKATDGKCVRANEYHETCKSMFGSCETKNNMIVKKNQNIFLPVTVSTNPQDSIEMKFLSSVTNACDKMSLTLVMCNTLSHYEECGGCQARLELFETCGDNMEDPRCAPLSDYFNNCNQPCN